MVSLSVNQRGTAILAWSDTERIACVALCSASTAEAPHASMRACERGSSITPATRQHGARLQRNAPRPSLLILSWRVCVFHELAVPCERVRGGGNMKSVFEVWDIVQARLSVSTWILIVAWFTSTLFIRVVLCFDTGRTSGQRRQLDTY